MKTIRYQGAIGNPGDGRYYVISSGRDAFASMTVIQHDPDASLSGTIEVKVGSYSETIDLSSERWVSFGGGPVAAFVMTLSGVGMQPFWLSMH